MNLLKKIFRRENLWNLLYLFALESLMFIRYYLIEEDLAFAILVLLILVFFTFMRQKGKITLKGSGGFYSLLILARYSQGFVLLAMIYPLAVFIYQMYKTE